MTPQTAPRKPSSELQRLSGVFFEPKQAFADIAARPRWWVPLIMMIVAGTVFMYCFSQRVGWESFLRQQMSTNERFQQLPVERQESAIEQQSRVASILGYVGTVVGVPVYALVVAGVVAVVFKVFLGARLSFRQIFGITSYSLLPGVLATGLTILVLYLKNPEDFDLRFPLAFNVAAWLPQETPQWLKGGSASIDLFTLWSLLLMATGLSVADGKLSWGKCAAWLAAVWLLWVVLKTAGIAITS
jgi:Yip1 domain